MSFALSISVDKVNRLANELSDHSNILRSSNRLWEEEILEIITVEHRKELEGITMITFIVVFVQLMTYQISSH